MFLQEDLLKFQVLDHSTGTASLEYAQPVPSGDTPTVPGLFGGHREVQLSYSFLHCVVLFMGKAR